MTSAPRVCVLSSGAGDEEVSDVGSGRLGVREAWIELENLRTGTRVRLDAGHITDMRTGAAALCSHMRSTVRAAMRASPSPSLRFLATRTASMALMM